MSPKTENLSQLLRRLISLLEAYGESHWASWLKRDLAALDHNDFSGIEHFLGAFGGMGSFSDLLICPQNGHAIRDIEVDSVNERLRALQSQSWTLAEEIRRIAEFND